MTVLAIDTASRRRAVCVLAGTGGELRRAVVDEETDVDVALPRAFTALVAGSLSHVVVVVGPGSYTGVRAGMAAALGVAHARGVPLHGVTSLDTVAAAARAGSADRGWALAGAGRGAVYAGRFEGARVGAWSRVELAAFEPGDAAPYSAEALAVPGLRRTDPALGLARAVPRALARPPLEGDALRALYGD